MESTLAHIKYSYVDYPETFHGGVMKHVGQNLVLWNMTYFLSLSLFLKKMQYRCKCLNIFMHNQYYKCIRRKHILVNAYRKLCQQILGLMKPPHTRCQWTCWLLLKKISSIIRHNRGTTTSANHFVLFLEVMLF